VGLKLYDALAGRSKISPHEMLKPYEVPDHIDEMSLRDMRGAALFWDCQMNDARLCLENILDAKAHGAEVRNYTAVNGFIKKGGVVTGVEAEDVFHKEKFQIHARHIVSAVGPWTDELRKMINPQAEPVLAPTKGVHIVVPKIVETHGALLTAPQDGRPFFVLPFGADHSLIGTTDTDFSKSPDNVSVEESDIQYLVNAVQKAFRKSGISRASVIGSFAGVRPLLKSGSAAGARSRSHQIIAESGLLIIVGGKYTTYRRMAQELCDRIARERQTPSRCTTAAALLPGTPEGSFDDYVRNEISSLPKTYAVGPETARRLVSTYGTHTRPVLDYLRDDPDLRNPLCHHTAVLGAEVLHAVGNEQARTISDILFRRSWLGYGTCQGTDAIAAIQGILKRHMGTELPISGGQSS
jgi:glycerol-3-phosphate dehydrogenase